MQKNSKPNRSGFTLIELLVVIGIIAVLAGMTFVAISSLVAHARAARTSTTIKKINGSLWVRYQDIERYIARTNKMRTETLPEYIVDPQIVDLWQGTGAYAGAANKPLAKLLGLKDFMKRNFPQTFAEAGITPVTPANHQPETENAECLYHFLSSGFSFGDGPQTALVFASYEVKDTDNDGLPEVVDAWGNPLRFYRWPTRMIRPQPLGSESTPQDETGTIASVSGWLINYGNFSPTKSLGMDQYDELGILLAARNQGYFTSQVFEDKFHTIETWNAPLIVSAGEDGELGLFEPTDLANKGNLGQPDFSRKYAMEDDIANWKLTSLGVTR